ncbi:hypothetical protein RRG08_031953 [Elysia crispata]|uniref:Uncharacterized protein n=1 Tax=Elysia crispata TaxID=231223 RepID=A0AAE0Z3Y4_9GAST|nr:hypothetical protein RRG08_031953 [Elysia crispata]
MVETALILALDGTCISKSRRVTLANNVREHGRLNRPDIFLQCADHKLKRRSSSEVPTMKSERNDKWTVVSRGRVTANPVARVNTPRQRTKEASSSTDRKNEPDRVAPELFHIVDTSLEHRYTHTQLVLAYFSLTSHGIMGDVHSTHTAKEVSSQQSGSEVSKWHRLGFDSRHAWLKSELIRCDNSI